MATITEQLQMAKSTHGSATIVLRSGKTISGEVEEINLADGVVVVDGWTVRVDEIAGARTGNGVSA
ncbi:MAG: hypothetical protein WHS89_09610 [Acidimicrobiales bacterium]